MVKRFSRAYLPKPTKFHPPPLTQGCYHDINIILIFNSQHLMIYSPLTRVARVFNNVFYSMKRCFLNKLFQIDLPPAFYYSLCNIEKIWGSFPIIWCHVCYTKYLLASQLPISKSTSLVFLKKICISFDSI